APELRPEKRRCAFPLVLAAQRRAPGHRRLARRSLRPRAPRPAEPHHGQRLRRIPAGPARAPQGRALQRCGRAREGAEPPVNRLRFRPRRKADRGAAMVMDRFARAQNPELLREWHEAMLVFSGRQWETYNMHTGAVESAKAPSWRVRLVSNL